MRVPCVSSAWYCQPNCLIFKRHFTVFCYVKRCRQLKWIIKEQYTKVWTELIWLMRTDWEMAFCEYGKEVWGSTFGRQNWNDPDKRVGYMIHEDTTSRWTLVNAAVRRLKMSDYRELVRMCEAQMEEVKENGVTCIIIIFISSTSCQILGWSNTGLQFG